MAKKESSFLNMVLTLLVITAVASTALGFVYELTKKPKAKALYIKQTYAIKKVLPPFDNQPMDAMYKVPVPDGTDSLEFYPATENGENVGVAVKTFSKNGYGGQIDLMVGFTPDGQINKISVLDQKETPGLGTKMTDSVFKDQFNGKDPEQFKLKVKKDGGDVDAITAATISSRAFCDAVEKAYKIYKEQGGAQ
ncbi:MAG TPA: RnfABCDGE type electron transport complex subunit G [Bacteroidales bacterium]|nr:RnfABCDGE type electron transport complex subunit G [Bacteroidales bacterium]